MTTHHYLTRARQVLATEVDGIRQAAGALDNRFCDTVDLLLKVLANGGKIVVTGVGKNLHIAEKISATLASTGSTSVMLNPMQAMHGDLGILAPADALVALSFSGESDELLALIPAVRRLGAPVVAVTGNAASSLAKCADLVLTVSVDHEACPSTWRDHLTTATSAWATPWRWSSRRPRLREKRTMPCFIGRARSGRALLCRVRDIMRTANGSPVDPEKTVRDASSP